MSYDRRIAFDYDRRAFTLPVEKLRDDPWAYFLKVPGAFLVPVAKLETIRARPTGIENAEKYMYLAAYEDGKKRKPISVAKGEHGTWTVLDGNSTTAIAKKHGWKMLPVIEEKPAESH